MRQVRKIGSLKDVLSSLNGETESNCSRVDQMLNFLDDDQEAPPSNWSKPSDTTEETFIVKAPHMDHEYCYLQQHLRSLKDKRVVQSVNAELRGQQAELLREIAATNYDMEGLSFEDERENEEPKGSRRYVKFGEKSRLKANGGAGVVRKRGKESARRMELEYEEEDEEEDLFEMPPYTGYYRSRNRYTSAVENDRTDDFDDMEEDGYHGLSRRAIAPATSLSRTRKRRFADGSESALPPPSSKRRVQESSPPSGQPPSPSKDFSSPNRRGRKESRRFGRKYAPVSEDRSPPKLSVDVIPDDRSTKDPEPTAFPESESLGATEICGPATISLPVGFETWSAEEEEKFEESKRRLLGPMGIQTSAIASQEPVRESKSRRKSSLQANQLVCERCKTAEVSSCQLCSLMRQVRKIGSLKDVLSSLNGETESNCSRVDQMLNFLDDDQEAPPSNWSKPSDTTEETFIVKAPHMDHEYCYLQQHLRSLKDKRVVQSVNAELRGQQAELLREIAATNYDMEGLSFEDERENEEPKGSRRYVKFGEKSRLKANGGAGVVRKRGKESARRMELEYEEEDEEEDLFEMPPYTGYYRSRNRYTSAVENDRTDDFDDMEEDGYHGLSRRAIAPATSLSRTRKRRFADGSESALPPPSSKRRVQESSPPSGQPPSPSKDFSSPNRRGRKESRRFGRKYGGYEAETANILIGITSSESKLADQSPSDLGSLQASQPSMISLEIFPNILVIRDREIHPSFISIRMKPDTYFYANPDILRSDLLKSRGSGRILIQRVRNQKRAMCLTWSHAQLLFLRMSTKRRTAMQILSM
nr:hypothetical transcript [Hymenolepis microstoma]